MDAQELQAFRSKSFQSEELMISAADDIQRKAFRKMWELEGDDPDVEEQTMKSKGSQAKKPNILGVGARVRKYKEEFKLKELQERPVTGVAAPPGTPPGNASILQFLSVRKGK